MSRKRRFVVAGACVVAAWPVSAALASFTRAISASESISSVTLGAPTALVASPSGHDVAVSWAAGSGGTGYAVLGLSNGASSSCPASGYAAVTTTAGTSVTDTGRSTPQGTWYCYQVVTTRGLWSSQASNPVAAAQLGVVAKSVAVTNGGTAGRIEPGDVVTITFNQAITPATGPAATDTICSDTASGTVVLGSTGAGTVCNTAQADLGTLTPLTVSKDARWAATWTWSAGNTVLTVTVGARTSGPTTSASGGPAVLYPTTTATLMKSTTGAFHVCDTNAGGGSCLPTASGAF